MHPFPRPSGDLLTAAQRELVLAALRFFADNEFDQGRIAPRLSGWVDRMGRVCATAEDQHRMQGELDRWVRWDRLPAYWLSFVFQLSMKQIGSIYFVAACRLYAESQINLNEDLALSSLENAYNAALQLGEHESVREIAADLRSRLRLVYGYYRSWYKAAPHSAVNPLTEHLYSEKTWLDLKLEFPHLDKPREEHTPADYLSVIDRCASPGEILFRVYARRFLGSIHEGLNDLDAAGEHFGTALREAQDAGLETEIGHLHRLYGYVLQKLGRLEDAARELRSAIAHESHTKLRYWQALSARELGDVLLRQVPRELDPTLPPAELEPALLAYRAGRTLFEGHVAHGVLPIARAVEQQLFRSFTDNALQAAMLLSPVDALAEIEAAGPRYVTDVVAEGKAAAALGAQDRARYRRARAIFHRDLAAFNASRDFEQDFRAYLDSVEHHREARLFYMKTRLGLGPAIRRAHHSDEVVRQLTRLKLSDVMMLVLHVGASETFGALVSGASGRAVSMGKAPYGEAEWKEQHLAYRQALAAAREAGTSSAQASAARQAIDGLLAFYDAALGPLFAAFLPFYQGRHLKIFPRSWMNEAPFSALTVSGKPLIEHCRVSLAQTLSALLLVHEEAGGSLAGALDVVHDEAGTPFYTGTLRALRAASPGALNVIGDPSLADASASFQRRSAPDRLFACHGKYDPDDPSESWLRLRGRAGTSNPEEKVPFATFFAELDLEGCRSVTVGACESGLGRTLVSAEYLGLPLAFIAAGARHVVATLWQVNQLAAAILLARHYPLLWDGEHTPTSALNDAQRALRRLSRAEVIEWLRTWLPERAEALVPVVQGFHERPFEHPYFWAGFYVSGDV